MRFTSSERRIFARKPPQSVSSWAAEHMVMADGPFAGARYRLDVNPYLRGVMDAWGRPEVQEVVVCGAPQIGKTSLLYACLCYAVDRRFGPKMLAMPDDETLQRVVEAKLWPTFQRTRPVREVLGKRRRSRISFIDGSALYLASAASPSQRASISVQDLFLDEEALFSSFEGKGDPVTDFLERTRSYAWKSKTLRISKPVGDERCTIWADLVRMDEVRRFHVACPACGTFQLMQPEHIVTEHGVKDPARIRREKLARYRCPHCGYHWSDYTRDRAVAHGEWRADTPVPHPRRIGFHIPAWLSAMVSLSEIAAQRVELAATDDAARHQAYANGVEARPYTPVVARSEVEEVMQLIDPDLPRGTVPRGYQVVTVAVDMQRVGFWWVACAWTGRLDCAVIDYGRAQSWEDVRELCIDRTWPVQTAEGEEVDPVPAWRAALDTGGGLAFDDSGFVTRTEEAYSFLMQYGLGVIHGTKGASHRQTAPVQWSLLERMPKSRTALPGGLRLYMLDTFYFKSWVTGRLSPESRQPIRLHKDSEESLAKQLTAEELIRRRGRLEWHRKRKDNHYLDCLCMNHALVHSSWTPGLARILGGDGADMEVANG